MTSIRATLVFAIAVLAAALAVPALAQEAGSRKELKRMDLPEAPAMEVVTAVTEYQPGDVLGRHLHHGTEMGYVVQGSMIQAPGKDPMMLPTGAPLQNLRDVPHGGFKIVGDKPLILFTVHIVDKGKPIYEWVK